VKQNAGDGPARPARMHRFAVNFKSANIFNGGFEVRKTGKKTLKCARLGHLFRAFTMAALNMISPYAKLTFH
jgi:hypothetical protein